MAGFKHLYRNGFGVYFYQFVFPKWYRLKFPKHSKSIRISTYTKQKSLAHRRVLLLSLITSQILDYLQADAMGDDEIKIDIKSILKRYRDCLVDADVSEQNAVYWGESQFKVVEEDIENQLKQIASFGLIDEVSYNLDNVDSLYDLAQQTEAKIKSN